jgi:predicted permease
MHHESSFWWSERVAQDVRFALRTLRRDALFSTAALVTLAVGIAATVSMFAIVNALLLQPLPFPDPDRLMMVWERTPQGQPRNVVSAPNFVDWRARNQVFDDIGAISQIPLNVTGLGEAEQVDGVRVTAEFFRALGVSPLLGRPVLSGEDVAGGFRSVVLSYAFWQQRYGGSPAVLGRVLNVNGAAHEIVGVMPQDFYVPRVRADLFIPLPLNFASLPQGRNLLTIARLKAGVTREQAQADMDRVAGQLAAERPRLNAGYTTSVIPLTEEAVGEMRRIVWVLFGAVACLLLLACANVANLFLIRASTRAQEMSVRLAIGAGRWRLVHQLMVESLVLTTIAGALGLWVAWLVVPAVPTLFPDSFPLPRGNELSIDAIVVLFAFATSLGIGVLFGLVPARHASRSNLSEALRGSGRTVRGSDARLRRGLVVVEVALAVVLVIGAGLMGRSLAELYSVNPGFDADRVLSMRMLLLPSKYPDAETRVVFLREVLAAVRSAPGVISASSVHFLPLSGVGSSTLYSRSDRPPPPRESAEGSGGHVSVVTTDYFRTMGIPLLQGRDFDGREHRDAPRVVIVNDTLAKQWFPDTSPVGRHLSVRWSTPQAVPFEIIGVVGDVRTSSIDAAPGPAIYISHLQEPSAIATLVVRSAAQPGSLASAVREAIRRVDPEQGVSQVQTLDTLVANTTARPRIQTLVLSAFGALALLIAAIGLYGVMSYTVEQRRGEIGVRMALGAAPTAVMRSVLTEGVVLAAMGIALGTVIVVTISSSVAALLYQTQATDPQVLASVAFALLAIALFASLLPARRATRVDPVIALRAE